MTSLNEFTKFVAVLSRSADWSRHDCYFRSFTQLRSDKFYASTERKCSTFIWPSCQIFPPETGSGAGCIIKHVKAAGSRWWRKFQGSSSATFKMFFGCWIYENVSCRNLRCTPNPPIQAWFRVICLRRCVYRHDQHHQATKCISSIEFLFLDLVKFLSLFNQVVGKSFNVWKSWFLLITFCVKVGKLLWSQIAWKFTVCMYLKSSGTLWIREKVFAQLCSIRSYAFRTKF